MNSFGARILAVVKKIPAGKTMTYGEVAETAGSPGAARAVGNIMSRNYTSDIPCHRVIRSDGTVGGYNRGIALKRKMLNEERIQLEAQK